MTIGEDLTESHSRTWDSAFVGDYPEYSEDFASVSNLSDVGILPANETAVQKDITWLDAVPIIGGLAGFILLVVVIACCVGCKGTSGCFPSKVATRRRGECSEEDAEKSLEGSIRLEVRSESRNTVSSRSVFQEQPEAESHTLLIPGSPRSTNTETVFTLSSPTANIPKPQTSASPSNGSEEDEETASRRESPTIIGDRPPQGAALMSNLTKWEVDAEFLKNDDISAVENGFPQFLSVL